MRNPCSLYLIAFLAACSGPPRGGPEREDVLRISTHFGLEEGRDSFLAHLTELTSGPLTEHFARIEHQGHRVLLSRLPQSPLIPEQLEKLIALHGQRSVHAMADGVVVEMMDEATAAKVKLTDLGLKHYEKTHLEPDKRLELTRCLSGGGPQKIIVRNVSQDEEWRLLLAREVDLVPSISARQLGYLRDVPSVRVVPVRTPAPAALAFQVRSPAPTADVELRRAISRGLGRQAMVEALSEDQVEIVKMKEDRGEARRLLEQLGIHGGAQRSLRLYFDDSVTDFHRVALVIEQQLVPLGIVLDIQALSFDDLRTKLTTGNFDMVLHRVDFQNRRWIHRVLGYGPPEFETAEVQGGDTSVQKHLEQDLPLTLLYRLQEAVVLDSSFCGAAPVTITNLSWLAAVHPCKPGENQ